jgi:hypothetical protein
VVGAAAGLATEGAADVGRHDPHVLGVDTDRLGQQALGHVGVLRGQPGLDAVVGGSHQDRVALDRCGGDPLVDHPYPGDVVGVVEDVGGVLGGALRGDVGADRLELQRSVSGEGGLDVDDGGQVVVVDVDQLGGVHRLCARLGDHQGDRVADVAHLVHGQGGPGRLFVHVGEAGQRPATEVVGGVDGHDALGGSRLAGVDAGDGGVGEGAPDEDRVGDTHAVQVVHEGALPQQQLPVFDAADLGSKDRSRHESHPTTNGKSLR